MTFSFFTSVTKKEPKIVRNETFEEEGQKKGARILVVWVFILLNTVKNLFLEPFSGKLKPYFYTYLRLYVHNFLSRFSLVKSASYELFFF